MRARWIVLPAVLALVAGELAAPPGPASAAEPGIAATPAQQVIANAEPSAGTAASTATYIAVSAGDRFTCAIRTNGTLACWGLEWEGRTIPPAGTFTAVSAGGAHACAIRTDGTLACWGRDVRGEASPPTGTFVAVATGNEHTCAVRTDGRLACWGLNVDGSTVPPTGTFAAVDAGEYYTCAVRTDGRLACWGEASPDYGQARPPSGTFAAVSAGWVHACGLRTDGQLACWGYAVAGRTASPAGLHTAVSAGLYHSCAIRTDGQLACWGYAAYGNTSPPSGTFSAVSAGATHTCAIRTDGRVACWGGYYGPQPTATVDPLPRWLATSRIPVSWTGTPASAPIVSYEVRYRRARGDGTWSAWTAWLADTTATRATFVASPGSTYCFKVRAWDADGMGSPWSSASTWSPTCTAVPLDDRSLVRSSSWVAGTGTAYYRHTVLQGRYSGAKLTRTGVRARSLALLATTCPTCGTVRVYWYSILLKTVSLYSPTTMDKQLIPLVTFASVRTGTLTIKIVGGGKPVLIDGVAISQLTP